MNIFLKTEFEYYQALDYVKWSLFTVKQLCVSDATESSKLINELNWKQRRI